jgi:hypothetical protein
MHPVFHAAMWAYQECVGGKAVSGEIKQRYILHGTVRRSKAIPGQVFQLEIVHVDPFGFRHTSVPNARIIP